MLAKKNKALAELQPHYLSGARGINHASCRIGLFLCGSSAHFLSPSFIGTSVSRFRHTSGILDAILRNHCICCILLFAQANRIPYLRNYGMVMHLA